MINTPQQSSLFRENALKEMNGVQIVHQGLRVVEAKSIACLMAALTGLLGILLWGIYGVVDVEVPARGMLLSSEKIQAIEQLYQDDRHDRETALQAFKNLFDKKLSLYGKRLITLDDLERARQAYITARETLSSIPRLTSEHAGNIFAETVFTGTKDLAAIVFVSHAEGKKVAQGMRAYLLPTFLSAYESGYIKGMVAQVSEYPASKESVYSYLGNMNLVDDYFAGGAPFVVKIILEKNSQTLSGLAWTTPQGASFKMGAGSAVTVNIIQHQYHPYELLTQNHR